MTTVNINWETSKLEENKESISVVSKTWDINMPKCEMKNIESESMWMAISGIAFPRYF